MPIKRGLQEPPLLLSMDDVAESLRLSRAMAYRLAATGELPTVRFGKSIRVRRETLVAWLAERESNGRSLTDAE